MPTATKASKPAFKITIASFNLIKGIMILIIVFSHFLKVVDLQEMPGLLLFSDIIYRLGYAFMPAFWIISGYSFKAKEPGKMLKTTLSSFCLPCIYVVLISVVLTCARYVVFSYGDLLETCLDQLFSGFLGLSGPANIVTILGVRLTACGILWFFWASFVGQNVLNLILRSQKKLLVQCLLVLASAAAGYYLMLIDFTYYCIGQGLLAVVFYYTGYLLKQKKLLQKLVYDWRAYLILIPISLAEVHFGWLDMWLGEFKNVVLDCIGSGCLAVLLLLLGLMASKFEGKIADILNELGVYSYWILLVHCVESVVVPWYPLSLYFTKHYELFFWGMSLGRALAIAAGVLIIKKISKLNYTRRALKSGKERIR